MSKQADNKKYKKLKNKKTFIYPFNPRKKEAAARNTTALQPKE